MKVKLQAVIDAIEMSGFDINCYYNKKTGEIIEIFEDSFGDEANIKKREKLEENWNDYFSVPGQYERNDYNIMRNFVETVVDEEMRQKLEFAISGRGAFRVFKAMIFEFGIRKDWFEFQTQAYKDIAINWCKENNIEFI